MIYFTSDWHIGHKNIRRLADRPFATDDEMHKIIIANYQKHVTDNDIVYFLGDICWNYQTLPGVLQRLPGDKRLVAGNHDRVFKQVWKLNTNPKDYYKFYLDAGFTSIDTSLQLQVAGQTVNLNHFPYKTETKPIEYEDRYWDMRPDNDGNWLIHGHIHNKGLIKDRMINVSVEMWDYKPVPIDAIINIMNSRSLEGADYIPFL